AGAPAPALPACRGDDPGPKGGAPPTSAPTTDDPNAPGAEGPCRVEVEVTGAATDSWEGRGTVRVGDTDGPQAIYQAVKGDNLVMAYSKGPDFPPSVTVTLGDRTFASRPGSAEGLDIRVNRKGAEIDTTALDIDGDEANVAVTFDCRKSAKG
ncbi:MAG: hypothetical protein WCS84_14290, partial [Nocardioides sp.]